MSAWLLISTVAAAAILGQLSAASFTEFPSNILNLERAFPANQPVELEYLRARDRVRHSRMLQNVGGVANFYVAGESDPYRVGLYFSKIKLGSPPQVFNVQIDTGSDILWVNCNSCTDCPRSTDIKQIELNFFDPASSSTASMVACSHPMCSSALQTTATQCSTQTNQCIYSFQYGDGSGTSGFYVSDTFHFDKILGDSVIANSSAPIFFGCSTYQSGDLTKTDRAIDGIFGFGQQDLSVVSQLASQGITPKVFSHCLKGEGNGGGILVLGEILDPGITYTPLVSSQAHYNLNLQSIAVSGQILQIDPTAFITSDSRGTIIDSGTTLAYLVEEAYDPLLSAITSTVSQTATPVVSKGNQCYLVSTSITEIFPLVTLNFDGGASMVLKPEEYLVNPDSVDGTAMWCFGFQKAQDQAITILGDLVLKDKIFVYDIARQRVGWTDYDCSQTVNVSASFGKDEYVNAGQIRMSSASRTRLFNKLIPTSTGFFLIHGVFFTGFFLLIS